MEDADWSTSDKPMALCSDGCLRVYDTGLKTCNSVLNLLDTEGGKEEGGKQRKAGGVRWRGESRGGQGVLGGGGRNGENEVQPALHLPLPRAGVLSPTGAASGQSEAEGHAAAPAVEPGVLPGPGRVSHSPTTSSSRA